MSTTHLTWPEILTQLLNGVSLSVSQAEWAMGQCITGAATPAQLAGLLIALRSKDVTTEELLGFCNATLSAAVPTTLPQRAVDIVGTGGDGYGTVNVSTTAAMIAAGAGIPVVKHGNRAASSLSGTSDVLTALGGKHGLSDAQQLRVLKASGLAFLHAAFMHPGFANVASARRELGVPTVFNYLGPLCNPAQPYAMALGVADYGRAPLLASVLAMRGQSGLVVRGRDGLDELTTTDVSDVWQVSDGSVEQLELDAADLGLARAELSQLRGGTPEQNATILRDTLAGAVGPVLDISLLNAASAIVAHELMTNPSSANTVLTDRFARALAQARESVTSGKAAQALNNWASATQREHAAPRS